MICERYLHRDSCLAFSLLQEDLVRLEGRVGEPTLPGKGRGREVLKAVGLKP